MNKRGGKRKGAGRKPMGKNAYTVTLTEKNVERAKKREKNFSGLLDRLSLSKAIGKLHDAIGREGLNEGSIRSQLTILKDQAEGIEATLKRVELNLKECRAKLKRTSADLERLEADTKNKKVVSKDDRFEEITEKLLQLFSRGHSLEQATRELDLKKVEAEHHADLLIGTVAGEEMIEFFALRYSLFNPGAFPIKVDTKGIEIEELRRFTRREFLEKVFPRFRGKVWKLPPSHLESPT